MEQNKKAQPIGVFDSGFGGLTVLHDLKQAFPQESFVYVADTARCPYGEKSLEEVSLYAQTIARWLIEKQQVKAIVIACNTATVAALDVLQKTCDVPIIGAIASGARACCRATKNNKIGIVATQATVDSQAYVAACKQQDPTVVVIQQQASAWVRFVEQSLGCVPDFAHFDEFPGILTTPTSLKLVRDTLQPLLDAGVDTIHLGCTHFPFLRDAIDKVVEKKLFVTSSSEQICLELQAIASPQTACSARGICTCYTTGEDEAFFAKAVRFVLGDDVAIHKGI